ncbi:hypothetical protein EDB87DRAFT_319899 [Lactarius vividus]|nr:hypothetical protein EDB87DRAFT_319899 [Lactarius vividus]
MSQNRVPPSFPQPFAPAGTPYLARDATGTPGQRSIDPAQVSAYPPERSVFTGNAPGTSLDTPYWSQPLFPAQSHGSTPNLMPTLNGPPRHLTSHIPPYQLIQGPISTPPAFPMPQVQGARVPQHSTSSYPPSSIVQTTHTPRHLNDTQVAPGLYSNYPPQAPIVSHSPLRYESEVSGVAHTVPLFQRSQDDSDDQEDQVSQASSAMYDGNMRPKGPPSHVSHGVRDTVRMTSCPKCRRSYPESQRFCAWCKS